MNLTDEELAAASVVETENGQPKVCLKMFTTSGHLSRHIKGHSGAKPYACPIQGCTSRFSRHDNMMQHYRSHTRRVTNPYQYGTPAFYSSIYLPSGPTVASPYHLASNAYMTQQQHIAQHQQGMSSYPQNGGENGESGEGRD
ncbi:hypothetical protein BC829DRAFT_400364 [Chytridium lagenaria]|nr:hypothetical protein BC829DRAFT_400364 [Chytridium lagenaria]